MKPKFPLPNLPLFVILSCAAITLPASGATWDYGATTANWGDALNWDPDGTPAAGSTAAFTSTGNTPDTITLNTSYPDTGSAITLSLAYGKNLAIQSLATNELYVNGLTVSDAFSYTLDVAKNGTQGNSGTMPQSGATWNIASGGSLTVKTCFGTRTGVTGGNLLKTGAGTLKLGDGSGSNTNSQYLQLNAGAGLIELGFTDGGTVVNGISAIASDATVRITASGLNQTLLGSSSYSYQSGVQGVAGTFDLNGIGQRIASLSGVATGSLTNGAGAADSTLTIGVEGLTARNENSGNFAGIISDGTTNKLALVINAKNAAFVQTLTGANTYTGTTTLTKGALTLNGGSIANSPLTMNGSTTLNMGNGSGTLQTVSLPSLEQNGTSAIKLDLTTAGSDQINTGNYTYTGGSIDIAVASQPGFLSTYTLVSYSGTLSGSPTINISGLTPGTPYSIDYGTGTASSITVTFGAPLVWNGDHNGNWDIDSTPNWLNVTTPAAYSNSNHVVFDDNATGTTSITLNVGVSPQSVSFGSSAKSYQIAGTGGITTAGLFAKSGSSYTTIATDLTLQGDALITNGTLDLIGADTFTFDNAAGSFQIGVTSSGNSVNLELSDDTHITAASFSIGQGGPGGSGVTSNASVGLGAMAAIHSNSIVVGDNSAQFGSSSLTTEVSDTSVEIRATDGTSRADMVVGSKGPGSDYSGGSGMVDFTDEGSTLDALLGTLTIGRHSGGTGNFNINTVGSFAFNSGMLDANQIIMGVGLAPNNKTSIGTLTSNGGTIRTSSLILVQDSGGAIGSATVTLNAGATLEATTITGQNSANAIVNWNEGTLRNLSGSDLTVTGTTLKLDAVTSTRSLQATGGNVVNFGSGTVIDSSYYSTGSPDLGNFSVTGSLSLTNATLSLHDNEGTPAAMTVGTKLVLIDYSAGSLTGTFSGLADGDTITVGPNVFVVDYNDPAHGGTAVTLTTIATFTPFEDWLTSNGVTPGDPNTLPAEDYNGDGLANMVEYVLNRDPDGNTQENLPVSVKAGTDLIVTFTVLTEALEAGFTPEIEYSETLGGGSWTTATAGMISTEVNGTTVDYTVTIPIPGSASKLFARLKVGH